MKNGFQWKLFYILATAVRGSKTIMLQSLYAKQCVKSRNSVLFLPHMNLFCIFLVNAITRVPYSVAGKVCTLPDRNEH